MRGSRGSGPGSALEPRAAQAGAARAKVMPSVRPMLDQCRDNRDRWKEIVLQKQERDKNKQVTYFKMTRKV